jgi:hypothetical protein
VGSIERHEPVTGVGNDAVAKALDNGEAISNFRELVVDSVERAAGQPIVDDIVGERKQISHKR